MSCSKYCILLLFSLLFAATIVVATTDPELKQCIDKCQEQKKHFGKEQTYLCFKRCDEYHKEKERRQGEGDENVIDPRIEYEQCRAQCRRQSESSRYPEEQCVSDCKRQLIEREKGQHTTSQRKESEKEERQSPFVFEERDFVTGLETEHGRVRVLPKFTERSKLLCGIENYRISIFEAEPQTFVVPNHWDADAVFFVTNGRGTVSLVRQNKRESFNIKQGDIVRIKAGTTAYLINRDNKEKLTLAKVLVPVNTPGEFQAYFGAGGENPDSFYRVFSKEILEAAFSTKRDRIERLFGQQRKGVIIKASEDQIRELSRHEEGGIWPFGGESRGTFNLYEQRPTHSNQYGRLYEVDSSQFRGLRDLDIAVSLANITKGAMTAPTYNSKATKIAIIVEGEGYFEMACPHLSHSQGSGSQEQKQQTQRGATSGPSYQRVSSRLTRGMVVVVPAGHPFVVVASDKKTLQVLCFEINTLDNEKFTLAGRRNVMNQLEREAKELAFGMPVRAVDEVFGSQQEDYFFKWPRQHHHQGRAKM